MNVLLVYPRFPAETFWSFRHALKFVRKRAALPPLGLLTVAAMLPRDWTVRLVDMNVAPLAARDLAWADLVFVSAMLAQRESARALIERCHAAGKTIVAGGPLFADETGSFPEVSHFVLDEAEITLPPFLRDLEGGCAQRIYRADRFADLAETPVPRWELADHRRYASMSVQYSRGCPFDCDFCNITVMFGRLPRLKGARQVIAELDALYVAGWRGPVFFVDDNLIGNRRVLKRGLLPALTEWRRTHPGISFYTEASINLADDAELTRQMVAAGFESVFVGIETPAPEGLAECDKRQNRGRDLVADVKKLQRAGLEVQGGFIVGFDSDTPRIFQQQWEFIQASGIVTAMVGLLSAIPGTKLHQRLEQEGRLIGRASGNNSDGTTNFVPRMGPAVLKDGYRSLVARLYAPGPYYQRVRTFLREYRSPSLRSSFSWPHLHAFARSTVRLGVFGRERLHYWHLLAWTFFRRPRQIPVAVTLAIYGHHFRKTAEAL